MQIYSKEVSLDEGFAISDITDKYSRLIAGKEVSLCSGIALFKSLRNQPIVCWKCNAIADRWVCGKGKTDLQSKPVLNLFGRTPTGLLVMMTRDHIIPKSLGGVDHNENLRPGCEVCNSDRGNELNSADAKFMLANPQLIDLGRVIQGRKNMMKKIVILGDCPRPSDVMRIMSSFLKAQKILDKQHTNKI